MKNCPTTLTDIGRRHKECFPEKTPLRRAAFVVSAGGGARGAFSGDGREDAGGAAGHAERDGGQTPAGWAARAALRPVSAVTGTESPESCCAGSVS